MKDLINKFDEESYNALHTALVRCAEEDGMKGEYKEYEWLQTMPRTSLIVFLVDKLHEMGYEIMKPNTN